MLRRGQGGKRAVRSRLAIREREDGGLMRSRAIGDDHAAVRKLAL